MSDTYSVSRWLSCFSYLARANWKEERAWRLFDSENGAGALGCIEHEWDHPMESVKEFIFKHGKPRVKGSINDPDVEYDNPDTQDKAFNTADKYRLIECTCEYGSDYANESSMGD
jgi:hypothetical protein